MVHSYYTLILIVVTDKSQKETKKITVHCINRYIGLDSGG